ncbi:hypothetical protein H6503_06490 [Candidatus Woesearchaeota archaeon]|nr:hypothetical protein [Candidatus Woesearchaeota archaeon]
MISIEEAFIVLKPLAIFIMGMVIYSVFIFHFYRYLARKDIIRLDLERYNTASLSWLKKFISVIFYIIKYILLVPLIIFFWFGILTLFLSFLSKESVVSHILLVSMAVIGATRIAAYYNEALSTDLAKMLPFALLGVYIVDVSFFSFSDSLLLMYQMPGQVEMMAYYLIFVIVLEFFLRVAYSLLRLVVKKT